ncbi:MAG: hypothetical protein VX938_00625, partial [Myxococcota bacterium]|nr:hypothetical protein [Myxococcota bacterium]
MIRRSSALLVLVTIVGLGSTVWAAPASPAVLGPEAAPALKRLGIVLARGMDCQLRGTESKGAVVLFTLACEEGASILVVKMTAPGGDGNSDAVSTRHGRLLFPVGTAVPSGLSSELDGLEVSLPWREKRTPDVQSRSYEVDLASFNKIAARRREAVTERSAPPVPPTARPGPPHLLPRILAPGDISAWLGTRGSRVGGPCPEACLDHEVFHLLDPRGRVPSGRILSWIREFRGEPKLWAAAAGSAWSEGDPQAAVAYADVATRLDPQDPDARRVWSQLTMGTSDEEGLTVLSDAIGDTPLIPPWTWLVGAAVLWGILAWRHREDPYAMPVVATGLVLGALVYGTAPSEPPLPTPPPPVPDALRASLAGGACQGDPALWTSGEWRIYATCDGTPTVFSIGPNGVRASSSTPGPVQAAAVAHLESRWTHKTAPPVVTDSPDSEAPHLW